MTRTLEYLSFVCLLSTAWPLAQLWLAFRHTALRSTCLWIFLTASVWVLLCGVQVAQPESWDAIRFGLLRLLGATLLLTPIVAVLGARRPGSGAWNLIVLGLVAVFAQLMLEQGLLDRQPRSMRVVIDGPRLTIYAVIALVGVVNYLPTRFGGAAALFAAGVTLQVAAIGPWEVQASQVKMFEALAGLVLSGSVWTAWSLRSKSGAEGFDAVWLAFRDAWGLVWSLRVRDRWNAAARHYGWRLRLGWSGLEGDTAGSNSANGSVVSLEAPLGQLRLLLRRFLESPAMGE